jgi:murein DD-endopeptidase MepM/ murein hydrolase activator NlpD
VAIRVGGKIFFTECIVALLLIGICAPVFSAPTLSQIEQKRKDAQKNITRLKKLENQEKNKLVKNQKNLEITRENLEISKNRYTTVTGQLNNLNVQLEVAVADYNNSNQKMQERLRHVYKAQRRGMVELLMSVHDLNSMLDVVYFEKIVLKNDYNRMVQLKKKSDAILAIRQQIASKKAALARTINDMNYQQKYIESAIAKNQTMINKFQSSRSAYEKAERELAQQSAKIQSMITGVQKNNKETFVTTGTFIKPIQGPITSPFGWRIHPIFKSRIFHSGIDIGGPNGGAIKAANSGKVIFAGWQGGYGKVVIIDHGLVNGKPTTTLYAHMSSIGVSNGQSVSKGQVIGREGSTGYSTGPHCHFEVRINGVPQNPMQFI